MSIIFTICHFSISTRSKRIFFARSCLLHVKTSDTIRIDVLAPLEELYLHRSARHLQCQIIIERRIMGTQIRLEDEYLFGWDPAPGIVSVWANRGGQAI